MIDVHGVMVQIPGDIVMAHYYMGLAVGRQRTRIGWALRDSIGDAWQDVVQH